MLNLYLNSFINLFKVLQVNYYGDEGPQGHGIKPLQEPNK